MTSMQGGDGGEVTPVLVPAQLLIHVVASHYYSAVARVGPDHPYGETASLLRWVTWKGGLPLALLRQPCTDHETRDLATLPNYEGPLVLPVDLYYRYTNIANHIYWVSIAG